MGPLLCLSAFAGSLFLGRRSLAAGLGGVLTTGYLYGILRANYLDSAAHFIFDSAVLGFYLSRFGRALPAGTGARVRQLRRWVILLIGWPCVMFLLPLQHPLIQLVGLRGNAFLVPFLLVGGWLRREDADRLALWLAALNVLAIGFAGAEYFQGVPRFFPKNAVTEIIYKSNDLVGYTAFRIPATFANAHSFAGTMVTTLPWLIGAWLRPGRCSGWQHGLLAAGIGAAVLGIFMAATRVNMVLLFVLLVIVTLSGKLRGPYWLGWALILGAIGYVVSGQERLQRFTKLGDAGQVVSRLEGSVNKTFLELAVKYPLGNGLGGGGTSLPYFLRDLLTNPIGLENEYSRILLEQGWPGLLLWIVFVFWVFDRRPVNPRDPWHLGQRLLWYSCMASFALGMLGVGLLTAIPQTTLLFLGIGFLTTRQPLPLPSAGTGSPPPGRRTAAQVGKRDRMHGALPAVG
jgi:hypothetical protein